MKCCHFKMTGRGKWLPLLAAFKTRESRFIRNKQNLIFKRDVKMKPDFSPQSLFIALGNSGTLLFFLQCVSLPLFSFLLTLIWSPSNDQNLMEGLINSIVQRHFDICPKGVEAFFFFFQDAITCLLPPVRKTNTPLLWKDVERREKCLREEKKRCEKRREDAKLEEQSDIYREFEIFEFEGYWETQFELVHFSVSLAYISTTEMLLKKKGCCFHPHTLHSKLWLSFS